MGRLQDKQLSETVVKLGRQFNIRCFLETGTYKGNTSDWASHHFEKVVTIETNAVFYENARRDLSSRRNIEFIKGDSAAVLGPVLRDIQEPCIFWLDAHKGGGHFGEGDHCPVLDEINAIVDRGYPSYVLIDDARAFLAPPPPPFDYTRWPSMLSILSAINVREKFFCAVIEDVILCVPANAESFICREIFRIRSKI